MIRPQTTGEFISVSFLDNLLCPECRMGSLKQESAEALECAYCLQAYPIIEGLPLLFSAASLPDHVRRDGEQKKVKTPRKRNKTEGAYHWNEYYIEDLLPNPNSASKALLLGCGDATESKFLHDMGFETVAFDIKRSSGADFLADAHRLPLKDETFDLVLSMQVLEHLHSPWVAMQEIARVLKPAGWFVGSVAFLKAYHNSYFHMTHKGVMHLLALNGLKADKFAGAQSLAYSLYGTLVPLGTRSVSRFVYGALDGLVSNFRAALWSVVKRSNPNQPSERFDAEIPLSFRAYEKLRFAPAVVFRAQKIAGEG